MVIDITPFLEARDKVPHSSRLWVLSRRGPPEDREYFKELWMNVVYDIYFMETLMFHPTDPLLELQ